MQQYRPQDILRQRLVDYLGEGTIFSTVEDVGNDIYCFWLSKDTDFKRVYELFGDDRKEVTISRDLTITILSVGYNSEKVRYVQVRVEPSSATEYL